MGAKIYKSRFSRYLMFLVCIFYGNTLCGQNLPISPIVFFHNYKYFASKIDKHSQMFVFTVLLKDSTTISVKARLNDYQGVIYLGIDNETMTRSIRPLETLKIQRQGKDFLYEGIPMDSCWLFRIKDGGKLKIYSLLAQENSQFIIAFQKGNDPVLPLTKENLEMVMERESPAVRKLISEGKLIQALKTYNKE